MCRALANQIQRVIRGHRGARESAKGQLARPGAPGPSVRREEIAAHRASLLALHCVRPPMHDLPLIGLLVVGLGCLRLDEVWVALPLWMGQCQVERVLGCCAHARPWMRASCPLAS